MAFTIKGEYDRLIKIKEKAPNKQILFECGCVCGYVTEFKYIQRHYSEAVHRYIDDVLEVWVQTGFQKEPELAFTITEYDVCKRYQDRKYRYNKKYGILEYFPYK
jgi:hypothetical protein